MFIVCRFIQSNGLESRVGLMGLVKDFDSDDQMSRVTQAGVSRVRHCEGERRFPQEVMSRNEHASIEYQ